VSSEVTLGRKLRASRTSQGRNIAGVAKELKIEREQVSQFEKGDYSLSSLSPHQRGYLKSYVSLLELDWEEERPTDSNDNDSPTTISRDRDQRLKSWVLSQKIKSFSLVTVVLAGFVGAALVVSQLFLAPELVVSQPQQSEFTQQSRQLVVSGETSPGSDVIINDVPVAVGLSGEFSENVLLARGVNRVEVVAVNSLSRRASQEFVVIVATPGETDN